jgi:hypothetical protein
VRRPTTPEKEAMSSKSTQTIDPTLDSDATAAAAPVRPQRRAGESTCDGGHDQAVVPRMESAFGMSFDGVRVRTDDEAASRATSFGARAYTDGTEIGFADGVFSPESSAGLRTIAHEFAHVAQHRGGTGASFNDFRPSLTSLGSGAQTSSRAPSVEDRETNARAASEEVLSGRKPRVASDRLEQVHFDRVSSKEDSPPPLNAVELRTFSAEGGTGFTLLFNPLTVKKWDHWPTEAFGYYVDSTFDGDPSVLAALAARYISKEGIRSDGDAKATAKKMKVVKINVQPSLHADVVEFAKKEKIAATPKYHVVPGYYDLKKKDREGGGGTGKGTATPSSGGATTPSAGLIGFVTKEVKVAATLEDKDVVKLQKLYNYFSGNFPDHPVFKRRHARLIDFLQFHSIRPEKFKKLPDIGGKKPPPPAPFRSFLDEWLTFLERTGGSPRGEPGGSPDGIIKFDPEGELVVIPNVERYVKGGNIQFRVTFAQSPVQQAMLNYFPHRASFDWTISRDDKVVDTGPLLEGRGDIEYDVDTEETGMYVVKVVVESPYFKDDKKLERSSGPLVVVEEAALSTKLFEEHFTSADKASKPFKRTDGKLELRKGYTPHTLDGEISAIEYRIANVDTLLENKTISKSDHERFTKLLKEQIAKLEALRPKTEGAKKAPYFIRAVYLSRETSASMEVKALMHRTNRDPLRGGYRRYGVIAHDLTLGDPVQHPGKATTIATGGDDAAAWEKAELGAIDRMRHHWRKYNDYPEGTIRLAIQLLETGEVYEPKPIDTYHPRKTVKKALGITAAVGGAILLVASPFTGGSTAAVGVILIKSAAAITIASGAASIAMDIQDRIEKEGELKFDGRLMLDLLSIITMAMGGVGMFTKALGTLRPVGKGLYLGTMIGLDVDQAILISMETRNQIDKVETGYDLRIKEESDPKRITALTRERDTAIAHILGAAAVNGGFLIVSIASGVHSVTTIGRTSGTPRQVREEIATLADSNDFAAIKKALADDAAGTHVLMFEERAHLEEVAAVLKPKEIKPVPTEEPVPAPAKKKTTPATTEEPKPVEVEEPIKKVEEPSAKVEEPPAKATEETVAKPEKKTKAKRKTSKKKPSKKKPAKKTEGEPPVEEEVPAKTEGETPEPAKKKAAPEAGVSDTMKPDPEAAKELVRLQAEREGIEADRAALNDRVNNALKAEADRLRYKREFDKATGREEKAAIRNKWKEAADLKKKRLADLAEELPGFSEDNLGDKDGGIAAMKEGHADARKSSEADLDRIDNKIFQAEIRANPSKHRAALPCFSGDTPVATPDGLRRIDELSSGDLVYSYDFESENLVTRRVTAKYENRADHFYEIDIGGAMVRATGLHPFWIQDQQEWTPARDLCAGSVLQHTSGDSLVVKGVRFIDGVQETTYNLSIADTSNYYVGTGVLAHNGGYDIGLGGPWVIYRLTNPEFPGAVYIGQTKVGELKRLRGHLAEALEELAKDDITDSNRRFFEFKKGVTPDSVEVLIEGIGSQDQADYLEQRNIDIERTTADEVMNRKEVIKSEKHRKKVKEAIMNDPKVKALEYCPR